MCHVILMEWEFTCYPIPLTVAGLFTAPEHFSIWRKSRHIPDCLNNFPFLPQLVLADTLWIQLWFSFEGDAENYGRPHEMPLLQNFGGMEFNNQVIE